MPLTVLIRTAETEAQSAEINPYVVGALVLLLLLALMAGLLAFGKGRDHT